MIASNCCVTKDIEGRTIVASTIQKVIKTNITWDGRNPGKVINGFFGKMSRILVLGYFGYKTNQLDGQTVKTRDVYKLVKNQDNVIVDYYDTQDFQYHKLSIFKMFWKVICCRTLFYLPAQNNLKVIFPIIYCLSVIFRVKIHYLVVGGWLREFIENLPVHRYMLAHIFGIHVETKRLKNELEEFYHFDNVDIFPNFRFFHHIPESCRSDKAGHYCGYDLLKICFISRVQQSKGLDTLAVVADLLKKENLSDKVSIDFYGQKTDSYFDTHLSEEKLFKYKGILQPHEVIPTLKQYDVLIFPTHYEGEGCPGILVEALSVGLPIIASNWKYNEEFVENGINGFLCDTYDAAEYVSAIKALLNDLMLRKLMAEQSYLKSEVFSIDNAKRLMAAIMAKN